tara:strand:+ start:3189 stop:4373 length:1185 start_codon:yes stop_codon:yes gene_type:complete
LNNLKDKLDIISGKRCIVVAPSGYLKGRGARSGKFIESFDCVVKCNTTLHIEDQNNELGRRCDIWYGLPHYPSTPWYISFNLIKKQGVKLLSILPRFSLFSDTWDIAMDWFSKENENYNVKWREASLEAFDNLHRQLDCVPFTGVYAVIDLLNEGAETVYAYGHDFYQTGYFHNVASKRYEGSDWHKIEPQMALFWTLLNIEPRFDCDDNLKQILFSKFASPAKVLQQNRALFHTDLNHFFQGKRVTTLIFRSCNIEKFGLILEGIEECISANDIYVLCQKSIMRQLSNFDSNLINYGSDEAFNLTKIQGVSKLIERQYDVCLIPYNGLELRTYYNIFLSVINLGIKRVFLVSDRGALVKLDDIDLVCESIAKYSSISDEYMYLFDRFDRKKCF